MSLTTQRKAHSCVGRCERGFVTVLMACVLAGCALLIVAMEGASAARAALRRSDQERSDYVRAAQANVREWYVAHAAEIDATGSRPPSEQQVLEGARVIPKWGVRVKASALLGDETLRYRRIAVWLPLRERSGTAFGADGAFDSTLGAPFAVVDGRTVEGELRDRTLNTLQRLARLLEGRFRARALADSDHRVDVNHFRPRDPGCNVEDDELPCMDAFTEARSARLERVVGAGEGEWRSAWGTPIEVSNGLEAGAVGPPFRMTLRSRTPWGSHVEVVALQSLD